ncbi:MAG: phosphoribosylamine--glycine ligase [Elusimicrobiota bacterium]
MKVLIVGSGAREHAIGWKLKADNPGVSLAFAPGNGGTALLGRNLASGMDNAACVQAAKDAKADLVVIGPEGPLAMGLADDLSKQGIKVFGPSRKAAQLETSKLFAKAFMMAHGLPTASFQDFDSFASALAYLKQVDFPVVIKADGLAQGKGVVVARDSKAAEAALRRFMQEDALGTAGRRVVIEEFLKGEELSVLAFFDGENFVFLPPMRDHKALLDGNKGPNTGGMGAVCPVFPDRKLWSSITGELANRLRAGLAKEGIRYQGIVYFGLMLTDKGPKLLEFNARFGDPETQTVLPLCDAPLLELLDATCQGELGRFDPMMFFKTLETLPRVSVCVVLAAPGYPDKPITGGVITGVKANGPFSRGSFVFHAGTKQDSGKLLTAGGRVVSLVSVGADLTRARAGAYALADIVRFEGMQLRRDIGF